MMKIHRRIGLVLLLFALLPCTSFADEMITVEAQSPEAVLTDEAAATSVWIRYQFEADGVLPDAVVELLPTREEVPVNSLYIAVDPAQTSVLVEGGQWSFQGWDQTAFQAEQDIVLTGTWTFRAQTVRYSVTFAPGASGEFEAVTYTDLEAGTATPAPPEPVGVMGRTFTAWSPALSETVTGDVTYVAQWRVADPVLLDPEFEVRAEEPVLLPEMDIKQSAPVNDSSKQELPQTGAGRGIGLLITALIVIGAGHRLYSIQK